MVIPPSRGDGLAQLVAEGQARGEIAERHRRPKESEEWEAAGSPRTLRHSNGTTGRHPLLESVLGSRLPGGRGMNQDYVLFDGDAAHANHPGMVEPILPL